MALPFDQTVKRNARALGFNTHQASILSHVAINRLHNLQAQTDRKEPVTLEVLAQAIKDYAVEEVERERAVAPEIQRCGISILDDMEADLCHVDPAIPSTETVHREGGYIAKRFKFDVNGLEQYFGAQDPYVCLEETPTATPPAYTYHWDLLTALCAQTELAVELGKHLRPEDLVNLYATSKTFHYVVNEHMLSSVRMWIAHRAPEAGDVFPFKLYRRHLVPDPTGRTWSVQYEGTRTSQTMPGLMREVRNIPGLRYLQLVLVRDRCCRQMMAMMARHGFLMPKTMHSTLLRLWLVMDIPTSGQRQALLRNRDLWTDVHLYNAQMFFLKLSMLFNDPIYGPFSNELLHVMLGQKGLYPLWQLLFHKRFTKLPDLLALKVRYDYDVPDEFYGGGSSNQSDIYGVPVHEAGRGHCEGWGLGDHHLLRPDELIPLEAVARGLELDQHLMNMMTWGYVDYATGENIVPTEQDLYMPDEELLLHNVDTTTHWKPKHALKKRFADLPPLQQQQIVNNDQDDRLRALAWTGDTTEFVDGDSDESESEYTLDDEINRGFIVPPARRATPPSPSDTSGWADFVNAALCTIPPDLNRQPSWGNRDAAPSPSDDEDAETVMLAHAQDEDDVSMDCDSLASQVCEYFSGTDAEMSPAVETFLERHVPELLPRRGSP